MTTKDGLQVNRLIQGKREKVFEAWIRPEIAKKWFYPEDMELVSAESDPRVGGKYRVSMKDDDDVYTAHGTYREIVPNQKLVFTHSWEQADPVETMVTVEFKDRSGGTEVTLAQEGFVDPEETKSHEAGWKSALENLAKQFPREQ